MTTILIMKQTISGYAPLQLAVSIDEARFLIAGDARVPEAGVHVNNANEPRPDECGNAVRKVQAGRDFYDLRWLVRG